MEKEELYEQSIKDIFYKEEDMELAKQILTLLKGKSIANAEDFFNKCKIALMRNTYSYS